MSENKHTPGPWSIESWSTVEHFIPEIWGLSHGGYSDHIRRIEDARLAAAAPDLLEACRKALYALKGREHDEFLREAIAKATGERP